MDPASAIGVTSAVLSFVDFSYKIVRGAVHIYGDASSKVNHDWEAPELVAQKMQSLARLLGPPAATSQCLTRDESEISELAASCEALAKELAGKFESLKPKNAGSKRQCLWAATKAAFKASDTEDLEKRLENCRSQLQLHLTHSNYLCGREMAAALESIRESQKTEVVRSLHDVVQTMKDAVDEVVGAVNSDRSLSQRALSQLKKALDVQDENFHAIAESQILHALAFPGIHDRYDMIHEAHMDTFQWMYDDEAELIEAQKRARALFSNWLSSGNGIVHISGKLGSGKSTLMKFLVDHPETRKHLESWAGDRELVLASFFFWRPGAPEQRSISGLYRSLLYDSLREVPSLIKDTLPEHWRMIRSKPWLTSAVLSVSDKDIRRAFASLVKNQDLHARHQFCFFIDGLDEYEENAREDHRDMVGYLCEWAASGAVKICVSSREYNVFMNAFDETRRIRLHHLTRDDMVTYVSHRLKCLLEDDNAFLSLVHTIIEKAQGIFLWVTLVVREIRHQIDNGVSPQGLSGFLKYLPEELEDLYLHILHKLLRPHERLMAYRTFALMGVLEPNEKLLLWEFSFMDEYVANPSFAIEQARRPDSTEARLQRLNQAKKQLNAWCRGLVEVESRLSIENKGGLVPLKADSLSYTHRSVADFVANSRMREEVGKAVANFSAVDALSQMVLACLQSSTTPADRYPIQYGHVGIITALRFKAGLQTDLEPPYSFLRALDDLESSWAPQVLEEPANIDRWKVKPVFGSPDLRPTLGDLTSVVWTGIPSFATQFLSSPTLRLQLLRHDHPYPPWRLKHDVTLRSKNDLIALMAHVSLLVLLGRFWEEDRDDYIPDYTFLETLCSHYHHSPNLDTRLLLWPKGGWEKHPTHVEYFSIWANFLIRWSFPEVILPWILEDVFADKRVCRDTSYWGMKGVRRARREEWLGHCGRIFEVFLLTTGLDSFFEVSVSYNSMEYDTWLKSEHLTVTSTYTIGCRRMKAVHRRSFDIFQLERYPDPTTRAEDGGKELTWENSKSWDLRGLIEEFGLPNKDVLFRLIEERELQMGELAGGTTQGGHGGES